MEKDRWVSHSSESIERQLEKRENFENFKYFKRYRVFMLQQINDETKKSMLVHFRTVTVLFKNVTENHCTSLLRSVLINFMLNIHVDYTNDPLTTTNTLSNSYLHNLKCRQEKSTKALKLSINI